MPSVRLSGVATMVNFHLNADEIDLWVWVDPRRHTLSVHLERFGRFDCGPASRSAIAQASPQGRDPPFPAAAGAGAFEDTLETVRATWFGSYPSRWSSIRAFRSESSAAAYRASHLNQTRSFLLRRGSSVGTCAYSTHDPRWISRLPRGEVQPGLATVIASRYWRGAIVDGSLAEKHCAVEELLFVGRIDIHEPCLPRV